MRALASQSSDHATPLKKRPPVPFSSPIPQIASFNSSVIQRKAGCACGGDCPSCAEDDGARKIQTKLQVSAPGDQFEQEADRVAEHVMRMPAPYGATLVPAQAHQFSPVLQRNSESSGEQQTLPRPEEETLSARANAGGPTQITSRVQAQIDQLRGGGQPLSQSSREFFEPRFGQDFSQVRIHTSGAAAESARQLNAQAYTLGHDIVLGGGQTSYETPGGMRLLAHELTHVMQQGGGRSLAGPSAVNEVPGRVSRMIQRQQTDAGFEAGSGVGTGITNGTMTPNNSIMGQTFTAQNCRGLYGCNINFEFGKAYQGIYPYASAGRDVRGIYVKISASFDSTICGTCGTVHLIQDYRYITQGAAGMETAQPTTETRRTRAGWGNAAAPSRGWGIDTTETSTSPLLTTEWFANPGSSTTPAVFWDVPGHWTDQMNQGKEFHTCAICDNTGSQRRVMACVNWGYYTDSTGSISFRPAIPAASCGPTQELQDATTRWDAIAGNTPANIDFTRETGVDQTGQRSVLWFQFDSTVLRQDAEIDSTVHLTGALLRIRQHLALGANARIVVHGYASEEGDATYNLQLSRRRAETIQARLVAEGIPADRITIQPHGENRTMPTRAYNRRVEIEHTLPAAGVAP